MAVERRGEIKSSPCKLKLKLDSKLRLRGGRRKAQGIRQMHGLRLSEVFFVTVPFIFG